MSSINASVLSGVNANGVGSGTAATAKAEARREQAQFDKLLRAAESAQDVANAGAGISDAQRQEVKKACQSFEGYFMQMMFRSMRSTLTESDGLFKKSQAEKMFTEMLDEEYAKKSAETGGIGLADMMQKQILRQLGDA